MEEFLINLMQAAPYMPYLVVVGIIMLSGLGAPIPEDIPLMLGGLMCGMGHADIGLMLPICLITVVGADLLLYGVGLRWGHHVTTFWMFRRFLTPKRLHKAESSFHKHGGKTLFIARFLPGVRAATFFSAGMFKIPLWKMLFYDGTAALLSVPLFVTAAYLFADRFDQVKEWAKGTQLIVIGLAVMLVIAFVGFKIWRARRSRAAEEAEPTPAKPAPKPVKSPRPQRPQASPAQNTNL